MRVKLLPLLIAAAAATAGAASAQQASFDRSMPLQPRRVSEDGAERATALNRELALNREIAASRRTVFAVVGQNLVSGELKPDQRLAALVDPRNPTLSCAPSQRGVQVVLSCSNGATARLLLDPSGCSRSRTGQPASLCIGLTPELAARRLTAPAGTTLRIEGEGLVLEPVTGD